MCTQKGSAKASTIAVSDMLGSSTTSGIGKSVATTAPTFGTKLSQNCAPAAVASGELTATLRDRAGETGRARPAGRSRAGETHGEHAKDEPEVEADAKQDERGGAADEARERDLALDVGEDLRVDARGRRLLVVAHE